MFRRQTEQERDQDKADGSLFFRSENKDLAPDLFWRLHVACGLTWRDRAIAAMSNKLTASVLGEHRRMEWFFVTAVALACREWSYQFMLLLMLLILILLFPAGEACRRRSGL
jgi:hypothetical protein